MSKGKLPDNLMPEQSVRDKLVAETSRIAWRELEVFFAKGVVVHVSPELELVDVACEISSDNTGQVEQWIESGALSREFDDQAVAWSENNAIVWCVVVTPWVLVQSCSDDRTIN